MARKKKEQNENQKNRTVNIKPQKVKKIIKIKKG